MSAKIVPASARPLDGYIRVSRVGDRDGESFISPEVQEKAILEWAKRNDRQVIIRKPELNVSGGTMDRPVFNELMERIRNGQSGGIIVWKSDRFARSLLGAVTTLAELGQHDAAFASATEPQLDYSTPAGQAFLHMLFVFAEFVRASIKESWATAAQSALARGIHISPNGYLGYDKGEDGRLKPNAQAPIAVEIFERRANERHSWLTIAEWLNEVSPKAEGQWTPSAVHRLCAMRVYRGEASRYVKQNKDGREPIVNPDAHPALVPEDLWRNAQMVAKTTGHKLPAGELLSGLVRCAGCRYRMSKGSGKGLIMYKCRGRHASGNCPEPAMILTDKLDAHVEETILAELDTAAKMVPDNKGRQKAVRVVEGAHAALEDFRKDTAARKKLGSAWHDWLDQYLADVRDAQAELDRFDGLTELASESVARDEYLALAMPERREVLGGFIDAVFVRRSKKKGRHVEPTAERTRIAWRGQGPTDLPTRRQINEIKPFDFGEGDVDAGVVTTQAAP